MAAKPNATNSAASQTARARGVLSIRWIATTIAVVLTVAAVLGVGAVAERNSRRALDHEIRARLQLQARNLAASSSSALLGEFPELTLMPLVKTVRAQQPELQLVTVVDHRNLIQGDADARLIGSVFTPPMGLAANAAAGQEILSVAGPLLVARTPIAQPGGGPIGEVYVGLPLRYIDAAMQASRRDQLLLLALLTLLGAAAAFVLMSQLLSPVGALREGLSRIGRGDLDTPIVIRDRTELGLLAGTVNEMAQALKHAQVQMLERERLAHEVDLARQIQQSLLPAQPVTAGPFDIRGDQRSAAEVGGDYWDVLPLPDGRVGLAVADVAGKGLAGCLVMSMLSALLRAQRTTHPLPANMLATLDERLSESLRPGVFVTMCYAVLDPVTGRLTFASAGHNPLLVWRRATGDIEVRASKGIPLGAIRGGAIRATLRDETIQLGSGDVCLQFTDGYTEAFRDGSGELFGIERLQAVLREHAAHGGEAVRQAAREAVRAWSGPGIPADDETLLVITCEHAPVGAAFSEPVETADETDLRTGLAKLDEARRTNNGITLNARLDALNRLAPWVRELPELASLPAERIEVIGAALYEACANIVEHGCDEDGRQGLEVWWLPATGTATSSGARSIGNFVVRDAGRPFRPSERMPTDFNDPAVRSRGRGLGLEIMHRALAQVSYYPATLHGNITVLCLGPGDPETAPGGTRS